MVNQKSKKTPVFLNAGTNDIWTRQFVIVQDV